ncbi:hypothetical protein BJ878DRAFT_432727 [Calycina marina]|uniref:BHLH domain-containing protein n=1 Tax=Calycina marina TaxID=1763456 RepID=A0A9P7ZAV6_9HELO|nr:hypothetical protein BJ878DRAFT_432727 [Calycina marina]
MPRNPLTPASSTEIHGKDGLQFPPLQPSFELPPPAVANADCRKSSSTSYQLISPTSPAVPVSESVKTRRRSSVAQAPTKDVFSLPAPPTRSRKIIQMKPPAQEEAGVENEMGSVAGKTASKKRQPSTTSVAGRKIARKTAHSLIERRRRSKMNEEFGVLKDMIPACEGEMHKLAILQASIDYVRYLEDCVTKLQAENRRAGSNSTPMVEKFRIPPTARTGSYALRKSQSHNQSHDDGEDEGEGEDVDMEGSASPPLSQAHPRSTHQPSLSPALYPQDSASKTRQDSYSSISTDPRRYSFTTSANTSPAIGPNRYDYGRASMPGSALTSPALLPQSDQDQDATAALLMLNTDRRGYLNGGLSGGRGMSVRDLLSS